MLWWCVVSACGLMFVSRTTRVLIEQKILQSEMMTKIGTAIAMFTIIASFFFRSHLEFVWLLWLFSNFLLLLMKRILQAQRVQKFHDDIVPILDEVHLLMSIGRSYRESLETASQRGSHYSRVILFEFLRVLRYSQAMALSQFEQSIQNLLSDLLKIDRTEGKKLEHLKSLRYKLGIESYFRHRSRQVTAQTRIQAAVMTILYVALLIFVVLNFGFFHILKFLSFSICFFAVGLIWIQKSGRKIKWKV